MNGSTYEFGPFRTSDFRPKQVLGKYIWIEFNIDNPDYARAYSGYDALIEDSVPISPAGITLVEYTQIE